MKKHLKYLKYLLRHKYYVFIAGLKVKAPIFRLLIHDWSKFLPSEWFPYVEYFYGNNYDEETAKRYERIFGIYPTQDTIEYWNKRFDLAWLHHQHYNKHHYQYWILREDSGNIKLLDIPDKYIRELVADWAGAGKAITGRWEVKEWYYKNRDNIQINDKVRDKVEEYLEIFNNEK